MPHLIDVTPTILALLDLPIPAHIEGKPIVGLTRCDSPATGSARPAGTPRKSPSNGPHRGRSIYRSRNKRSSKQRLAELGYPGVIETRQMKSSRRRGV